MDALYLQIFVSLVLVLGSVILFAHSVRQRDNDHADRLALFPIEEDDPKVPDLTFDARGLRGDDPRRAPEPPHTGETNGHRDSDA